jgi:cytochrome c-type biogenesis protein CcmH
MTCFNSIRIIVILIAIGLCPHVYGGSADGPGEEKIRRIEDSLIAPCCWNQPISQHYSAISEQMRKEVREMAEAGKSRDEILDHYVAIYGERILAAPRPKGFNRLAYILPYTALLMGGVVLVAVLRKRLRPVTESTAPEKSDSDYDDVIEKELNELDT